jgi:hypothetical protein
MRVGGVDSMLSLQEKQPVYITLTQELTQKIGYINVKVAFK